jgi:hypothetical protein
MKIYSTLILLYTLMIKLNFKIENVLYQQTPTCVYFGGWGGYYNNGRESQVLEEGPRWMKASPCPLK